VFDLGSWDLEKRVEARDEIICELRAKNEGLEVLIRDQYTNSVDMLGTL
jgi:hypothetical protein